MWLISFHMWYSSSSSTLPEEIQFHNNKILHAQPCPLQSKQNGGKLVTALSRQICSFLLNLTSGLNSLLRIASRKHVCTTHPGWLRSLVQRFPDSNARLLTSNLGKTVVLTLKKMVLHESPGCVRVIVSNKLLEFRRSKLNIASTLLPDSKKVPGLNPLGSTGFSQALSQVITILCVLF